MSRQTLDSVTDALNQASVADCSDLSFSGRSLKLDQEQDAQEIVDAIKSCSRLNSLELKGNTLGVNAAKAIGAALEQHSHFKRAMWSDLFTGRLKTEIPDALKFLCGGLMTAKACLVELDLSDNAFGPNGMIGLTDFLKSSSCYTLRELRLNNNGLGITGGKMLAESLLACHAASVQAGSPLALEIFVSGRGRLEDDGATALAKAFKAMGSLVEVHMPQNGINARGITALAEAFESNTKLKHINLSDNTFTEKGSISMAKALPLLSALEVINFDDCLVRTAGVKALAKVLANNNHQLKILKLSGNEITKDGAEAIVGSVTNKSSLEELSLNANQLGESGIEHVKRLMTSANKIQLLSSFSDDEGSDEEEAEGSDDEANEEDKSEDDEGNNESGEEVAADAGLEIIGQAVKCLSMSSGSPTVQDFLASPTAANLKLLGPNRVNDLITYVGDKISEADVTIPVFMKISESVSRGDGEAMILACELADALLSRCFSCSRVNSTDSVLCNALLVHLGLIKSEDKHFRPPANVDGALIVLERSVRRDYFPRSVKDTLTFFIEQYASNSEKPSSSLHQQLLRSLQEL